MKCGVCNLYRDGNAFFCADCIRNGHFSFSSSQTTICNSTSDRQQSNSRDNPLGALTFAQAKKRCEALKRKQNEINERFTKLLDERRQLEELEILISEYEFNIANIQKEIQKDKDAIACKERLASKLAARKQRLVKFCEFSKEGIDNAQKKIDDIRKQICAISEQHKQVIENVKLATKEKFDELKNFIFPVTEYNMPERTEFPAFMDSENVSPLLVTNDAFVHNVTELSGTEGTFSSIDHESMRSWSNIHYNRQAYSVVEAWLPCDDVLTDYYKWGNDDDSATVMATSRKVDTRENDAYRISAALAFIAQLLNITSYLLDVRYPTKLSFAEFYSRTSESGAEILLTDQELAHKVAKLDLNLFYLCLTQKIEPYHLNPRKTLKNLNLLLNSANHYIGGVEPLVVGVKTYKDIRDRLPEDFGLIYEPSLLDFIGNDTQDDFLESDWENVSQAGLLLSSDPSISVYNVGASSGIVSSIVTSLASATSYFRKQTR